MRLFTPETWQFQSTPLVRGETSSSVVAVTSPSISIHSPHARGDVYTTLEYLVDSIFQSAPLMRGET